MFRGRFDIFIDEKGRVAVPAKLREVLRGQFDERLIVTNYDNCLWAYPVSVWQDLDAKSSQSF